MRRRILAATALMAFTAVLCNAQPAAHTPPTPAQMVANEVARLTKLLDLNATQQSQATAYFTAEETALANVRSALHSAHTAIQADVKSGNTADIATQANTIGTLTSTEVQAQATADAQFYAILTPDQQSKYESLGPHGLGGPGGPSPHGLGTH